MAKLTRNLPLGKKLAQGERAFIQSTLSHGSNKGSMVPSGELASGRSQYNWNRYFDSATGGYPTSDRIGLAGGSFSTYSFAGGNPLTYVDPFGLQLYEPEPRIPGYSRPNNTQEAASWFDHASWFDQEMEYICVSWNCPSSSTQCKMNDAKSPTDFLPAASSITDPPKDCICETKAWIPKSKDGWDSNDTIDLADKTKDIAKEGPSILARMMKAMSKWTPFYR